LCVNDNLAMTAQSIMFAPAALERVLARCRAIAVSR
jgi:hypothetical protein